MKYIFPFLFSAVLFCSCNDEKKPVTQQQEIIKKYISDNHLNVTPTGTGLYYIIDEAGSGAQPKASSKVTVAYKGYFVDGKVFDESGPEGITFGLDEVIKGWTDGIPYFKKGGKGKLIIPADLGYGTEDYNGIPGNSVLIFDIKLIDVL